MSGNRILQKNRIESLTDGIFAVAMTILALSLPVPLNTPETQLPHMLLHTVLQDFFIFVGSFVILGTQWVAINFQHGFLVHVDRTYVWLTLMCLLLACVVPFSSGLLMEFPHQKIVIYIYAANLLLAQLFQWATMEYSMRNNLNNSDAAVGYKLVIKRIMLTPFFYIGGVLIASWSIPAAFVMLILPPLFYLFPSKLDKYTKAE